MCGNDLAAAAGTIERQALVGLLERHFDTPLNVINVAPIAEERGLAVKMTRRSNAEAAATQLTLTIHGPDGAVDGTTPAADRTRHIVGRVYGDLQPRVVEINGYPMDMVPVGPMVVIQNDDKPGMIGMVGQSFGGAGVNIADMAISRRANADGTSTALMLLKLDEPAPAALLETVGGQAGVLKIAGVELPAAAG